ncbi:protein-cysteine N-palmitoyltransferase HHAT isoform X2 [Erinaceus europaeus]|uniref:Protein-cysteine N-palmitoyltransferase HHAT isoform X2 n=1 Tax=Erinaceus europaeus TaxID=9365 RepID=A0ABM3WD07_ERIEU|nr:protein-cysteine N-palmitoyltransferase HHAT isoform X2 [Erinaceus europaeus]
MGPGRPAAVLPRWELALYLLVSLGFHFYSFFRVYRDSREYEELLDEEFGLEPGSLLPGLKKDPTDFEWSFWMEWGRRRLGWLLLGHAALSQVSTLLAKQHRPWVLTAYGVWACWRALDTPGLALALLHVAVCLGIAQLRSPLLSWLCALLLLCSLRLDTAVDGKGGWPDGPQSERDLLRFSLTVRCLFCTAASLERGLCGAPLPWVLAYLFYYPTFHNGPVLSFPRFCAQMRCPQPLSPGARLALLVAGLGRLLCWWALAELLAQLMYTHALCASPTLLGTVSAWTLGGLALAQVHFFYVKYLVLFGVPALLMRLDGLVPPPQPRCVSTMFSFSGMWRYFDVGLHEFLIRAIAGADTMNPLLLEAVFPIIGQDREKWREEGTQRGGEKDRYLQTCVTTAHEASPLQVGSRGLEPGSLRRSLSFVLCSLNQVCYRPALHYSRSNFTTTRNSSIEMPRTLWVQGIDGDYSLSSPES